MYHNETAISQEALEDESTKNFTNAQKRTYQMLLDTAVDMFDKGLLPTIPELANEAKVGRATAYRYFPTRRALLNAVMKKNLAPMSGWESTHEDVEKRVNDLLEFSYPKLIKHEGALRATLQLSLEKWAKDQANEPLEHEELIRGYRKQTLLKAIRPMNEQLTEAQFLRMQQALSVIYGTECMLVLKDIWQLENNDMEGLIKWIAKAIINQTKQDAEKKE